MISCAASLEGFCLSNASIRFIDATDLPYLGQGRHQAFGEVSDNDPPDEERDGTFGGWTTGGETEDDERSNGPTIS